MRGWGAMMNKSPKNVGLARQGVTRRAIVWCMDGLREETANQTYGG